jgi:hypothetical protein
VIVPLFALANAGIAVDGGFLAQGFTSPITLGILLGYVVGKPVGILGSSWLLTRLSGRRLRPPVGWVAATVRVLVGEGSPVRLGTPALILDVELPTGGEVTAAVPPDFQGFAYVLEGEAAFGANRRRAKAPQLVLLGRGEEFRVTDASPGTRYLLMAGEPYGEVPVFNGPFVD